MPEVAEATHLRSIAENLQQQNRRASQQAPVHEVNYLEKRMVELEQTVGLQSLLIMAIMKKLCENTSVTIADIKGLLHELDASDGSVDGELDLNQIKTLFGFPEPVKEPSEDVCIGCRRPIHEHQERCIYCGGQRA
tara:strand:- start:113 stop:520 length:408 start_codon:yes stop_codon:yes gene_type:complete